MSENLPVYIQIHDELQRNIERGVWKIGERLPSERALALRFNVSRMTLRQAVLTLVEEGIVERRIGAGTFIAREKVHEKLTGTTSFSELMHAQGKVPRSELISYFLTRPTAVESEVLQLEEGALIVRMERIRYGDDEPICYEIAAIPHELVANAAKHEVSKHFYQTLKDLGHAIGGNTQKISASVANEKTAELLKLKRGDAVLRLRQISYLKSGQPFEYVLSRYAGNRFEILLEK
ncbi:MAG: GntR family transcriptional regulator [Streptococcaceae bacterium]|nr:GntR family transcriptional regulator [Streptococcaceae bacterium]